jgi:hypothetical protein
MNDMTNSASSNEYSDADMDMQENGSEGDGYAAESDMPVSATTKLPKTKAEKLAEIDAKIERLQARRTDIENDVVTVPKSKVVVLPEVGDEVNFMHGRTTATTVPMMKSGIVVATKEASVHEGKRQNAQIKVQMGSGFDAEFVVLYPAQIIAPTAE